MESSLGITVSADSARQTVSKMRELSTSCLGLFSTFFDASHFCWPYALTDGDPIEPDESISTSSVAMILHACSVSDGHIQKSILAPANRSWKPAETTEEISAVIASASPILFDACRANPAPDLLSSKTWGKNDPLTLLWLYELLVASDPETTHDLRKNIVDVAVSRIQGALENPSAPILDVDSGAISHVFPVLRLVQLKCAIERNEKNGVAQLQDISTEPASVWFETQLHKQLSLSAIPNSEFDPASLIFALEGLLLIAPHKVGNLVVTRTLTVMHESARTGSYWRPVRPLRTTPQGYVLLPQSVEVANSLLRICSIRNEAGDLTEWQPLVLEALQNYREWLEGRLTSGLTAPSPELGTSKSYFVGWQSDHTHTEGQVHLWATSQALLFCEHYGAFMQQHLARSLQRDTGVKSTAPLGKVITWEKLSEREPLKGLPKESTNRAYDRIHSTIIGPRLTLGTSDSSSVLLYGPPGTGKTTLVEEIAKALDYDLIRITPSDFIQSGEAGVEERARRIFEMLMEQSNTVVLFDEIDNLLLSRDSKRYTDQSEMFQFMTPSMLIKLNDLRKKNEVVFILATNYEDNLDEAIKRAGRIDEFILFLPPDLSQRTKIIREIAGASLNEDQVNQLAKATPLFAYQELKKVCAEIVRQAGTAAVDTPPFKSRMDKIVGAFEPAITLGQYKQRCMNGDGTVKSEGPLKEVLYLTYLVAETDEHPIAKQPWIEQVLKGNERMISEVMVLEKLEDELKAGH